MAIYKVRGPDGAEHELNGPEGATDEQIIAAAEEAFAQPRAEPDVAATRDAIEPGIMDETRPVEQRLLENINHAAGGFGMGQLAGTVGKLGVDAATLGPSGIRNALSGWFKKRAEEQYAKSTGLTTENATDMVGKSYSADEVRRFGRLMADKEIVSPYASPETMLQRAEPALKSTGEGIADVRNLGEARNANPLYPASSPAPTADGIIAKAEAELGDKYSKGLRAGERPQFDRTLEQVKTDNPQTYPELAESATGLNQYAESPRKLMQPQEATTDVANLMARESDDGLNRLLTGEEQAQYAGLKDEYGMLADSRKILRRSTGRDLASTQAMPLSHTGALNKLANVIGPASTRATVADKIANALRVDPMAFGTNGPALQRAMQAGKESLGSTVYMLQQQDPDFKTKFDQLQNE